jgi:O-succinylbenzoic acid--CoA ligase
MVAVRALLAGADPVAVDSLGGAAPFTAEGFAAATTRARELSQGDGRPLAVSLVPPMLAALDAEGDAGWDLLATYDAVLVGGGATPRSLVDRLLFMGVHVFASYGMTETCGGAVFDGWPLDGVRVSAGPDGRLEVCGAQVALGYRDGRHADRWRTVDGLRCFRTEDLGAVAPDGQVSVHGRADDVVQVGGASVSLGAVEQVLRADPRVADAHVVAVADPAFGASPVAFVVLAGAGSAGGPGPAGGPPAPAGAPDAPADDLASLVEARLGRAARPRAVLVVPALPVLESSKPDRGALTALAELHLAGRRRA